jgi:AraC family transcriptional regulator
MSISWTEFLPLLVHIQAHLDEDLSLEALSARMGVSPTYFHKSFKAVIGETPKAHVERLRLERAAFRILLQDESLINIALDHGFGGPETFSRAFRRRFGMPPGAYRAWARVQHAETAGRRVHPCADFSISDVRIRRLAPAHLAFIRHVGPYEAVPDALFSTLARWTEARRTPGSRVWMGIGHDAPGATAADKLRFDAALVVPSAFNADDGVAYQFFAGGEFAIVTHAGAHSTLSQAYRTIFPRVTSMPEYDLVGLPAVEIYQSAQVISTQQVDVTDICLPVTRRASGRRS